MSLINESILNPHLIADCRLAIADLSISIRNRQLAIGKLFHSYLSAISGPSFFSPPPPPRPHHHPHPPHPTPPPTSNAGPSRNVGTSSPLTPINNDDNPFASASASTSPMATPIAASRI